MKTIYFTFPVVLFVVTQGQAQLTLTKAANEPASGDVHAMVSHDSTTAVPRNKGTGQSWNFSSFTSSTFTETITYTTASSVPASSLFPGATISASRGGNNKEFYVTSGNDWLFKGEYQSQSGDYMMLSDPALFMRWPVTMATTFSDVASGNEVSGTSSTAITGTLMYEGTGTGTVTLPGGAVHNNCLQVTSTLVVVSGTGTGAVTMTQVTYRYYSSLRKFHIAEIQYSSESGSTDFGAYFDRSGISVDLNEGSLPETFHMYPNPTSDLVNFENPGAGVFTKTEITDAQGRLVLTTNYSPTLDVTRLAPGIYNVTLKSDKAVANKRLVISR